MQTPRDLLAQQTNWLAQRIVEAIAQTQCKPDEYAQLGPVIEQYFDARRERLNVNKRRKQA